MTEKVYSGEGEGLNINFDDSTKTTDVVLFVVFNGVVTKTFLQNCYQFGNPFYLVICFDSLCLFSDNQAYLLKQKISFLFQMDF